MLAEDGVESLYMEAFEVIVRYFTGRGFVFEEGVLGVEVVRLLVFEDS